MPLEILSPDLQNHEALKGFNTADELGKSFTELHARVSGGAIDLLPEDVRKDPSLANFKTVADVAKSYVETKKLVGTMKKPPAQATDYKFTMPDGVNPKIGDVKGFQSAFAADAHKLGLAEDQADGIQKTAIGYFSNLITQAEAKREETRKTNEAALRQEWGADYDKNFNGIVRLITKAGGKDAEAVTQEMAEVLKGKPLAMKAFARIASLLSEDSIESLGGGSGTVVEGEDKEFQEMQDALKTNDQKHPLNNSKDPNHMKARERFQELSLKHFSKKA